MTHKCLNKQSLAGTVGSWSQWYCSVVKSRAGRISSDLHEIQFPALCSQILNWPSKNSHLQEMLKFILYNKNGYFSILLSQRAFLVCYCVFLSPEVCRLFPDLQVLPSTMQTLVRRGRPAHGLSLCSSTFSLFLHCPGLYEWHKEKCCGRDHISYYIMYLFLTPFLHRTGMEWQVILNSFWSIPFITLQVLHRWLTLVYSPKVPLLLLLFL